MSTAGVLITAELALVFKIFGATAKDKVLPITALINPTATYGKNPGFFGSG
ncbi:MAG TPA: hypothetical protein VHQ46_04270 [Desulfobacteria bacterium]|nr:hypothetical protein [Desulfobacteria bacterium]